MKIHTCTARAIFLINAFPLSNAFTAFLPNAAKSLTMMSSNVDRMPYSSSVVLRMSDEEGEDGDVEDEGIYDSQPSDSSSEDLAAVDVAAEEYVPTATESFVDDLPGFAEKVDSSTRAKINEALLKLESVNPTEDPSTSSLLNGVWTLKYSGGYSEDWALPSPTRGIALFLYDGGLSPGLFALSLAQSLPTQFAELGDLQIYISRDQPRIEAKISAKVFGNDSDVSVKADLEIETGIRMKETYKSATIAENGIDIPEQLQYSRDLYITYLDDDLLVVRTATGVPEVLVRQK